MAVKPRLRVARNAQPVQPPRRKLIAIDPATYTALDDYRRDSMKDWEEIAEEAFRDLLKKHGRSADLREALRLSLNPAKSRAGNKPSRS